VDTGVFDGERRTVTGPEHEHLASHRYVFENTGYRYEG
jgi:hypothetical protein